MNGSDMAALAAQLSDAVPDVGGDQLQAFDRKLRGSSRVSAIYFMLREGRIVYIGQTRNLRQRLSMHHINPPDYDEVAYLPTREDRLSALESSLIAALRPPLNKVAGWGGGLSSSERTRKRRAQVTATGGRRIEALLTDAESDALDRLTANGETVSAAVGAAILWAAEANTC